MICCSNHVRCQLHFQHAVDKVDEKLDDSDSKVAHAAHDKLGKVTDALSDIRSKATERSDVVIDEKHAVVGLQHREFAHVKAQVICTAGMFWISVPREGAQQRRLCNATEPILTWPITHSLWLPAHLREVVQRIHQSHGDHTAVQISLWQCLIMLGHPHQDEDIQRRGVAA